MSFVLSDEQKDIVNFFPTLLNSNKFKSIGIKAFAGCGKSFILKYLTNQFSDKKFLGLAFNNSIAKENKLSFPKKNTKWFTLHGFAREYLKHKQLNFNIKDARAEYKPLELLDILGYKDNSLFSLVVNISNCFKVFCQSDLKEITDENILKSAKAQMNDDVLSMFQIP